MKKINEEWAKKLSPGIFVVGYDDDINGGQIAIVDKGHKHYAFSVIDHDNELQIESKTELTLDERNIALEWDGNVCAFLQWLNGLYLLQWLNGIMGV